MFSDAYEEQKEEMLPYFYWLSILGGIGIATYKRMEECFLSPKELFLASEKSVIESNVFSKSQLERVLKSKREVRPEFAYERLLEKGILYVSREDSRFPKKLLQIADSPIALFVMGELPDENEPSVSVIGARECSFYGEDVASVVGNALGKYRIQLISGMARGIDSLSQTAALRAGGKSFAILGSSVDVCYPKESRTLYDNLKTLGGIISEYPPGTKIFPSNFARRNRIISGLCDVLLVVEAKEKSGTLITVDCALEQGKEVAAIPGRITDRTSNGCNELIRQGAEPVNDVDEFVLDIKRRFGNGGTESLSSNNKCVESELFYEDLSMEEKTILGVLDSNSFIVDELCYRLPKDVFDNETVFENVLKLSQKGLIVALGGGRFRKV